jgi:hypothetical protein
MRKKKIGAFFAQLWTLKIEKNVPNCKKSPNIFPLLSGIETTFLNKNVRKGQRMLIAMVWYQYSTMSL